jgi:D-xylose transport system substrate-binding protein
MRKGVHIIVAAAAAGAVVLTGCSSSKKSSTTQSSSSSASTSASASDTSSASTTPSDTASTTPTETSTAAAPPPAGGKVDGKGAKVGIILPDTQSSNRWVAADPQLLKQACKDDNLSCDIQNGNGSAAKQKTIAQQMAAQKIKVLLLVNLDPASGAAIEQEATKNGIITVDYDRLTPKGGAALYVSFDNTKVGALQGKALTQCPQVKGKSSVKYVDINGAPTDNNATLFKTGYDSVLSKASGWKKVGDQTGEWKPEVATRVFNAFIQKNKDINAVMVANDTMAAAVIARLQDLNLAGKVAVSGQDAQASGLQYIMSGQQCFTIYKPSSGEAIPAIAAAAKLANGQLPDTHGVTIEDPVTHKKVPAILAAPQVITKANVAKPINDGYTAKSQTCTGKYVALCKAAGVK